MKKIKHFLNVLEEKYLFRYGKRTWQAIAALAILSLAFAIIYFSINVVPTSREEVTISKMEFDKNKIDEDFDESNNVDDCTLADYNKTLDSLRKAMPKSEWIKLGDSAKVTRYREVERYHPWFGFYTDYEGYEAKEYRKNYDAVPNILNDIWEYKSLDSSQFCDRIEVLRMVKEMVRHTKPEEATRMLREYYKNIVIYNNNLTFKNLKDVTAIFKKVEGKEPFFKDPYEEKDHWNEYRNYVDDFRRDSITQERVTSVNETIEAIQKKGKIKEKPNKHKIARMVLSSPMEDADIDKASTDFFASTDFTYTDKTVTQIFGKYHRLFFKKVKLAEKRKMERELEKEENALFSRDLAMYSFASIMAIATILLLFSIRTLIKERQS
jgi:hypothetical protein